MIAVAVVAAAITGWMLVGHGRGHHGVFYRGFHSKEGMKMYVREGRSMGVVEYVIGTLVTIFAIVVTIVMGVMFIIGPICGLLWVVGRQIWNWELPRIAPIEAIVMTVFLGFPICMLLWFIGSGLWPLRKGKIPQ